MTDSPDLAEKVLGLLKEKVGGDVVLTVDSDIVADTGLDSVSVMDLVMEIEDEFDVTIPLDRMATVKTVKDMAGVIETVQQ
ncbi:MAG: acyl carrier protein [Pseudomonadota bacterium]